MTTLPVRHPAEVLQIDPEGLHIANSYLVHQTLEKTAQELGLDSSLVASHLSRPEIKSYINTVFRDMGFNNRFKIRQALDCVISRKFQELQESDTGSSKDIAELLALSHKMSMEELDREIALEKIRSSSIRSQVNVQINEGIQGGNYANLLQRLLSDNNKPT